MNRGSPIQVGIYAPNLDEKKLGAPQLLIRELIQKLKNESRVELSIINHYSRGSRSIYKSYQYTVSSLPVKCAKEINAGSFDVVHFFRYYDNRVPYLIESPTVLIYHGDAHWEVPELYKGSNPVLFSWKQRMVELFNIFQFNKLVFVSDDLKYRVEQRYSPLTLNSVTIPNGINLSKFNPNNIDGDSELPKSSFSKPFILTVVNHQPIKNPAGILETFKILKEKGAEKLDLVICGDGWEGNERIAKKLDDFGIRDSTYFFGYVQHNKLPEIYSDAEVFFFPSLRETFGMPILEAMACGTPVVTSNRYAMPEVGGDAVILCDPTNHHDMAASILELLDDRKNEEYQKLGLERAKRFSWSKVADEYISLYNDLSD